MTVTALTTLNPSQGLFGALQHAFLFYRLVHLSRPLQIEELRQKVQSLKQSYWRGHWQNELIPYKILGRLSDTSYLLSDVS